MVSEKKLASAARVALTQCLGVETGEKLLIVTNLEMKRIGEALFKEGEKLGAESTTPRDRSTVKNLHLWWWKR
jgi:hypothetical protein